MWHGRYLVFECVSRERLSPSSMRCDGEDLSGVSGAAFRATISRALPATWTDPVASPDGVFLSNSSLIHDCVEVPWGVLTTVHCDTSAAVRVLQEGFCVVVIGDLKTPDSCWATRFSSIPRVVFIPARVQNETFGRISSAIDFNHFGRKNLGYLFAIRHKATIVFDFDDDNMVLNTEFRFSLSQLAVSGGLRTISSHSMSVNPFPYFRPHHHNHNVDRVWPRGIPLNSTSTLLITSATSVPTRVCVVQCLAAHDPDVDAIYRLTGTLPLNFSSRLSIAIDSSRFAPFNAQATLWGSSSHALLYLPVSVHGRVSDIWRSYVAQRVINTCLHGHLVYSSPCVVQHRNAHNYFADFHVEVPLYERSNEFIRVVNSVSPMMHSEDKYTCVNELQSLILQALYVHKFIEARDLVVFKNWQAYLQSAGLNLGGLSCPFSFVYLVQGIPSRNFRGSRCRTVLIYDYAHAGNSVSRQGTVITLRSDAKLSWTAGRNFLLRKSLELLDKSMYYVFLDDDVVDMLSDPFENQLNMLEHLLIEHLPAVGYISRFSWQTHSIDSRRKLVSGMMNVDAILNAFHRDTIGVLIPYVETFDSESWYYSQLINSALVASLYAPYRVGFDTLELRVDLNKHRYGSRRAKQWRTVKQYLKTLFLEGSPQHDALQHVFCSSWDNNDLCNWDHCPSHSAEGYQLRRIPALNLTHPLASVISASIERAHVRTARSTPCVEVRAC